MSVQLSASNHNEMEDEVLGKRFPKWIHLGDCDDIAKEIEHPLFIDWSNVNARSVLTLLGLVKVGGDLAGEISIPEARRAVMRARATFDRVASRLIRYGKVQYSPPRANEDGSVEIRPLRYVEPAVGTEYLARQIDRFEKYVEHVAKKGATHVSWG